MGSEAFIYLKSSTSEPKSINFNKLKDDHLILTFITNKTIKQSSLSQYMVDK